MAYGFKLGQIEGLDSSVEKVNLTITSTTTASYVLNYGNEGGDEGWTDNIENPNFTLSYHLELDEYVLIAFNMDEPDVGDEYAINLSLPEEPTQAFTEAVGMATEAIYINTPSEFQTIYESILYSKISDVVVADGKPCYISTISWTSEDATDIDAFNDFYTAIKNAAQKISLNAYIDGNLIILKSYNTEGDMSIIRCAGFVYGGTPSFEITNNYVAYTSDDIKYITCSPVVSVLTHISTAD